jgi:hypothetical protein
LRPGARGTSVHDRVAQATVVDPVTGQLVFDDDDDEECDA